MDVKHTTIDKASVRREAAVIPDLTHKNNSKPQDHMSTTAAPPLHSVTAAVSYQVPESPSAPSASTAAVMTHATEDRSPQASFMGIPPELRLYIYEALWPPTKRKYTIHSEIHPDSSDALLGRLSDRVFGRLDEDNNQTRTALLRVNKQVSQEATPVLLRTSDLTLDTYGLTLRRTCGSSVTSAVRACVTSIRVRIHAYQLSLIQNMVSPPSPSRLYHYPNVEKLEIFLDVRGSFGLEEMAGMMFAFISNYLQSTRLKSVAFELYSTSRLGRRLSHVATPKLLRDMIQRSLREKHGMKGERIPTIDVLWERSSGDR